MAESTAAANVQLGTAGGLGRGVGNIIQYFLQKKNKEKQKQQEIKQAIEQSLLEAALKDQRLRPGADLSQLNTSGGMQGMLGQIPQMFEPEPVQPSTSISISERPYSDIMTARGVLGRTPKEWAGEGMAQKTGGWPFGTWGLGSKMELSPDALAAQKEAQNIISTPKTTQRISFKGGAVDTTGEVEYTPEEEETIQEAMADNPDRTREEIVAALQQQGYL